MNLADVKILSDVSLEYGIPVNTLHDRLKRLEEGIEYKRLGMRQPTLLSPEGVIKLIKRK
jgi:hypothetical protein